MTSNKYFGIAGIFLLIFIVTYFGEYFGLPIWIHRLTTLFLAIFAGLGLYQKKKEETSN